MTSRTHTPEDVQKIMKPWVELTDDEIEKVYALTAKDYRQKKMPPAQIMFAKTIQEFLKKKNS